ncbi:MAG: putative lipid II flippase FtsW [Acidimicrobiales bacterium]
MRASTATVHRSGRRAEQAGAVRADRGGPSTSSILLAIVALLCVIGVVMVGSASEVISIEQYNTPWAILLRELMWMGVGLMALWFSMRLDYGRLRHLRLPLLLGTFALLLLVLLPGIGVTAEGSSRWIGFSQFRLQPSELMKLALVVFGADLIVRRQERGASHRTIIGPLLLVAVAAAGLILLQPDMGTALVIGAIAIALLFASGVSLGPIFKVLLVGVVAAVVVGLIEPYRRARLLSFLDPTAHASGSGYQVTQSLIGLGSGHLAGLGLGSGRFKWGSLPNAHTDFIFSVIGEELGIIGAVAVLALLVGLCWFGLRAAQQAPDRFGTLLGVGLVAWIAAETFINVGAVVGLLPVTGIPLPFISFGGSSLVITMAAAGILVNIARQGAEARLSSLEHTSSRAVRRRAAHGARVAVSSASR